MPAGPGGLTADSSTLARLTTAVPAALLYAASRCFLPAGTSIAPGSAHSTDTTPDNAPGSLRAVSTIAAVLGLIFLLSGLVITLPRGGMGSATSATSNTASSGTSPRYAQDTTATSATATSVAHDEQKNTRVPVSKPTPTVAAPVRTPAVVTPATPTSEQPQPTAQPLAGLFTPLSLQVGGFILFALGIVGVLLTRRRQRDRAHDSE